MTSLNNITKNEPLTEEVIDLRHYFTIINKFKWKIGLLAVAVSIMSAVIALNMTPIYSATATMLIEADQAKAVSFQEIVGLDSNRKEYYLTQFEIINSMDIAREVVVQLNLKDHADFIGGESLLTTIKENLPFIPQANNSSLSVVESDEFKLQEIIKSFSKRLTIEPVRNTQLVRISYESSDPKLASLVANTVGETYINNDLRSKMGVSKEASGWLNSRLSDLQVRLKLSEEKLQNYRERENLVDVEGVLGLVSGELEQTSEQLVIARNEKNKLESIMRVINEYGRNNIKMLESLPEITSHVVVQDIKRTLVQAELKVSELNEVYGPKHPKMIVARSELTIVKQNFSDQVHRLVIGIEKELNTNKRNVLALEKELTRIRAEYQKVNRKGNEYHQLKRDLETNRQLYDTFLSRSKETDLTSDFVSPVARFIDRALQPNYPIKPKKTLIVLLTFFAALGLGFVFAFISESLNDTIKSTGDVENKLAMRMLGLIPLQKIKNDGELPLHIFFDKDNRGFSEAIRTIRTSLLMSQMGTSHKIIAITSSIPDEGKSSLAINLAYALGQMERVLLIDADLRRPSLGKLFGYPAYQPGLSNLIANSAGLSSCVVTDQRSNIHLMPAGTIPPNPQELLSSDLMNTALKLLSAKYDRIIIDTAPTQAVADSLVLSTYTDSMIYVVKADSTHSKTVKTGIGRLLQVGCNVVGVVLNQVDLEDSAKYDNHLGYYDHYGYQSDTLESVDFRNITAEKTEADKTEADKTEADKTEADKTEADKAAARSASAKKAAATRAANKKAAEDKAVEGSMSEDDEDLVDPPSFK